MPTRPTTKKFFIETFGCQMNLVDSERAAAHLTRCGYQWTDDVTEADLILFNTCAVRARPAGKVLARVDALRRRKKPQATVGIMGCLAQAEGGRLAERSADIRLVLGTQAVANLPALAERAAAGGQVVVDVRAPNRAEFDSLAPDERRARPVAFVTIMEGCDKFCTFCIVPFTRGRERSRAPERILAEMRALAERGTKEVHLLGQNVNSYGLSRRLEGDTRLSFAELLRLVAARSGIPRIKFTTAHPRDFGADIVCALEQWPVLCPWVHLPPQAGSDRILAAMNRGYRRADYMEKVRLIRRAGRDISLTGDIIVGFPGETDEDFRQTMKLVREAEFDGLYIFKYSRRPGTVAAKWPDTVPEAVKTERLMALNDLQRRLQARRWRRYLGRIVEVLVEGKSAKSKKHWSGHSPCHKVVNFASSRDQLDGQIVKVRVTRINPHSLFGIDVESQEPGSAGAINEGETNGLRGQSTRAHFGPDE